MGMNDINSLSHTKWNCKYHFVFAPKYRRKVFYYEKRAAVGKILRQLCEWKGVNVIAAEACRIDRLHAGMSRVCAVRQHRSDERRLTPPPLTYPRSAVIL